MWKIRRNDFVEKMNEKIHPIIETLVRHRISRVFYETFRNFQKISENFRKFQKWTSYEMQFRGLLRNFHPQTMSYDVFSPLNFDTSKFLKLSWTSFSTWFLNLLFCIDKIMTKIKTSWPILSVCQQHFVLYCVLHLDIFAFRFTVALQIRTNE